MSAELGPCRPIRRALIRRHLEGHMDQERLGALRVAEAEEREGSEKPQGLLGDAA